MFEFEFVQWALNQLCFLGYMYQKNVTNHTNMSDDLFDRLRSRKPPLEMTHLNATSHGRVVSMSKCANFRQPALPAGSARKCAVMMMNTKTGRLHLV